jgi:DNA-binding HxlR family transcriptional regulator
MQSGERALSLLSIPLNVHILEALEDEQSGLTDLTQAVGLPPATTMRSYLRSLVEMGALGRHREGGFPGGVSYALTPTGADLLKVGEVLQRWLREAPDGPISLGSPAAKSAVKALIDGWCANIVRVLAARPMPLTKLARLIPQISYPTLERRLTAMRLVGLVEGRRDGSGRGTPYSVTPWMRRAVATLAAAAAWESHHLAEARVGRLEVEAGFLLATPLLELPSGIAGACRLAIELEAAPKSGHAGVTLGFEESRIVSCVTRMDGRADAWIAGAPVDWFRWMIGGEDSQMELGGDTWVGRGVLASLREVLMPLPAGIR